MKKYFSIVALISLVYLGLVMPAHAQTVLPDLKPTSLQLTDVNGTPKSTFQVGEAIYVSVTIQNAGGQSPDPGDKSTYETFYKNRASQVTGCNISSDPGNFYLQNGLFSAQQTNTWQSFPGGRKDYLFPGVRSWKMTTPGTYKAWVYVDYDCRISESNESNNQISTSYTIVTTPVLATTPTPTAIPPIATPIPTIIPAVTTGVLPTGSLPATAVAAATDLPQEGSWIHDTEVTTTGKNAARAGMLLDWTLRDYKWASDSAYTNNPLVPLWLVIQRIVYALFLFVVLVTAFILIVTRGRSLTAKRFLPRFFLVVLLVTFSFSLVQFLYQIIDIFQGFFLKNPAGQVISQKDLLYVGFNYQSFQGLRVFGQAYDESAFISLLLVKLTAFTYYAMVILLIFRKIILWFLIIVSPVFPLLLLFYPLRNTAKVWIGEFFRWLLYAPLFAIFLSGLVRLWHSGLPLVFNFTGVGSDASTIYPTAINILLGGPGQAIGLHNSVNLPDTFALYLVALLMLWTVIILPFILLQIFLDYMMAFNYQNNPFIKQMYTMLSNRPIPPFSPLPPTTPPPASAGLARSLPFARKFEIPKTTGLAKDIPRTAAQTVTRPTLVTRNNQTEISRLTNLSIPTMRDIARYESTRLSRDVTSKQEIERMKQTLVSIANPASVTSTTERDRFRMIRERLVTAGQQGNSVATTILNAATTYTTYNSQSSSLSQQTQQLVQHLASLLTSSCVSIFGEVADCTDLLGAVCTS